MEIGVSWNAVGQVIVTHQHGVHQGSLGAVLDVAGSPPWSAGAGDMSAIRAPYEGTAVGDGDRVFETEIIETPGHTPGRIAVLDRGFEILFAGDALNLANGMVIGVNPSFTRDMSRANASIQKLAGLEFDTVVFGHGDSVPRNASDAVKELAASL
jgi:glyoxylase-like metal-dependent hydrolase (beta-lactamase superfamily II)